MNGIPVSGIHDGKDLNISAVVLRLAHVGRWIHLTVDNATKQKLAILQECCHHDDTRLQHGRRR